MRIAFTHNRKHGAALEESEYDDASTIDFIAGAIERLGHLVEPIEVRWGPDALVDRMRRFRPDLVFNTVEGDVGPLREALVPVILEAHGFPCTGGPPAALATTLDKRLTKLVVMADGVPTPSYRFINARGDLSRLSGLTCPVIVKPNFEGSSMGIDDDSVVIDPGRLPSKVRAMLQRFPAGVLVEEFIDGHDVTVPFLEGVGDRAGVLDPVGYVFHRPPGRYSIYDYTLKNEEDDLVEVQMPARMDPDATERLRDLASVAFAALEVRDFGRADFRCDPDGGFHFLEMNPLPSLEPEAGIYAAAMLHGVDKDGVIGAIIESAARRHGLVDSATTEAQWQASDTMGAR
jgi:D-alanine-D-alanine ligase